jgi:hypothetical protein
MLARKLILGFGFAVLMPMLIHYGIDVFVPTPSWRHEPSADYQKIYRLREDEKRAASESERVKIRAQIDQLQSQQDARTTARQEQSGRIHFFVGAPIGIVVTLIGSFIRAQAIGGGLMLGGIFTFTGGCAWYWADLSRPGRFAVLLVAFVVLLWVGYQRLSELKQPVKPAA